MHQKWSTVMQQTVAVRELDGPCYALLSTVNSLLSDVKRDNSSKNVFEIQDLNQDLDQVSW